MKAFALPEGAETKIAAAKELSALNPYKMNSMTAKNLDSMWSKLPGGAMAMLSMAEGKSPIWGYLMGEGSRLIAREAPDAMTLATLKLMGSTKPIEPSAFKTAAEFMHSTLSGENLIGKGVKNVFKAGAEVIPENLYPTPKKIDQLKKRLDELHTDNSSLMNTGGDTGYYLPEHGSALASTAMRVSNILNQLKPSDKKLGMLNPARTPSEAEHAKFENALSIAEQPLVTLQKIKQGNLSGQDVSLLKSMYPALHARMSQKLMDEMIAHVGKGEMVPYPTRLALSRFMGQPLDASMTPQAILASQPKAQPPNGPAPKAREKGKSFGDYSAQYETPLQSRSKARLSSNA